MIEEDKIIDKSVFNRTIKDLFKSQKSKNIKNCQRSKVWNNLTS